MLRVCLLQLWLNLFEPALEESLYDSVSLRIFAGIDLGQEGTPEETTVYKFRHLLEWHKLGKGLSTVDGYLARNGIKISNGAIVNAMTISVCACVCLVYVKRLHHGARRDQLHDVITLKRPGCSFTAALTATCTGLSRRKISSPQRRFPLHHRLRARRTPSGK